MAPDNSANAADPFTRYWQNVMAQMGASGLSAPPGIDSSAAGKQMQRIFLDALAKYCDDFMRSPQFLEAMKRNMDNALMFRGQMDQFLAQAQSNLQTPMHDNLDNVVMMLRGLEERMSARLDALEARGDTERRKSTPDAKSKSRGTGGARPARKTGANRTKKKSKRR